MGKDPDREPPFFSEPVDAAFDAGPNDEAAIPYPSETENFHYGTELTVCIGTGEPTSPRTQPTLNPRTAPPRR